MKIFSLLLLLAIMGCVYTSPIMLQGAEVNNYEGENLGSINDFRENSIKGPQYVNISTYKLKVTGLVKNDLSLSYDDVLNYPHYSKVVTINCVEGWSVKILWEGVLISDLLNAAGIDYGANTVIFKAYDNYTSSLPLDYVISNNILLAFKMNNLSIPPERGFPFQVIAQDKYGYKWVKWVTEIEVSDEEGYQGYWERRGYGNDASIPKGL